MTLDGREAGGGCAAQFTGSLSARRGRGWWDVLALKMSVHRDVTLEPLTARWTFEGQRLG